MKKILTLVAVFAILTSYSQDCRVTAVGLSYVAPRGASIDIFHGGFLQIGGGLVYNKLSTPKVRDNKVHKHSLDILMNAGVRVYHVKYKSAIYTNIGYMMGNVNDLRMFYSVKAMLLLNQFSLYLEPYYAKKPGLRIGLYRLI